MSLINNVIGTAAADGTMPDTTPTDYSAFGTRSSGTSQTPFGYCGEYTDPESGLIYLRNRYYDPTTGRFLTEDPAKDGQNWYSYCGGNPVTFVDPWGLFDYDTKLRYDPNTYSSDVRTLQNELAWNGYLTDDDVDGYFGKVTLDAVNRYKNDKGLWNTGEYEGVVGLTTWQSLGRIYREPQDIENGVEIVNDAAAQYFDVTKPFNRLLTNAKNEAEDHKYNVIWFYNKVNHGKPWDIKREDQWKETMQVSYPGSATSMVVYGNKYYTPEYLGNFLYGYAGTALGLSESTLIYGSIYASGALKGNVNMDTLISEFSDHPAIKKGIRKYAQ